MCLQGGVCQVMGGSQNFQHAKWGGCNILHQFNRGGGSQKITVNILPIFLRPPAII